jgi:hypothetical protein
MSPILLSILLGLTAAAANVFGGTDHQTGSSFS